MLLACATLLSGCAVTRSLFRDRAAEERAAALLQVQLSVMRFADEYTAWITERVGMFQQSTDDPVERLAAQSWLVSQATSAFTIAAGPTYDGCAQNDGHDVVHAAHRMHLVVSS